MMARPRHRERASYGALDGKPILLRLPMDLRRQAERAAKREGLVLSEWIRRALSERLTSSPRG